MTESVSKGRPDDIMRFTFELTREQHRKLKLRAAREETSIRALLMPFIEKLIADEK